MSQSPNDSIQVEYWTVRLLVDVRLHLNVTALILWRIEFSQSELLIMNRPELNMSSYEHIKVIITPLNHTDSQ